jgi:hypothetical protein
VANIKVNAFAVVPLPPAQAYGIIADYRTGHQQMLPPKYFSGLVVEAGGVGAGTKVRFEMHAFGNHQTLHAEITEPEPGRVLVETVVESGAVTTFTVESLADGAQSRVTIRTEYAREGVSGWIEALFAPRLLKTIYLEELELLSRAGPG